MAADTPLIDPRTYADLVAEVEALAERYTEGVVTTPEEGNGSIRIEGWRRQPGGGTDLGAALVRVFGRFAELAVDRLNRLPERNFLAFLDLIGTRPEPPRAARVPITFELATGSPGDALVPAGTQVVATPLAGEKDPVLFETERDLVVTRSELAAVFTREPGRDRFTDATAIATGEVDDAFFPFLGTEPIAHRFYVGHAGLLSTPEVKDSVVLRITPADPARPWPDAVAWEAWNGTGWYSPASEVAFERGSPNAWKVTLSGLAAIPPLPVGGVTSSWLRGRLTTPLPAGELTPDPGGSGDLELRRGGPPAAGFAANPAATTFEPLDFAAPFLPFGERWRLPVFYLAVGQPLDKPASQVEIEIDVVSTSGSSGSSISSSSFSPASASRAVIPISTVSVFQTGPVVPAFTWEYWSPDGWAELPGVTFQPARGAGNGGVFVDSGTVRFVQPPDWVPVSGVDGLPDSVPRFWLRIRVNLVPAPVDVVSRGVPQGGYPAAVVTRLTCGFSWVLPQVTGVELGVHLQRSSADRRESLAPELGFGNQIPIDLSKDFFPFGEKPRIGDALYLASEEVFSKPGAAAEIAVALTNPGKAPGPPFPANPSPDLVLVWEYWSGPAQRWQLLGPSGPGVQAGAPNPYGVKDETGGLAVEGKVTFTCPPDLAPVAVGGKTGRFVRVRVDSGNYGLEATYVPTQAGSAANTRVSVGVAADPAPAPPIPYRFVPATFQPPSIRSLLLGYDFNTPLAPAEHLMTENDFVFAEEPPLSGGLFTPFTPPRDDRPTLYLGFDRPGDSVGFAARPAALYMAVSPGLYDPAAAPRTVIEEAAVAWEYWSGGEGRWRPLGTRDETRGLTRRGPVTFLGPADFGAATQFGRRAFWLRARWERGDFPLPPRLARVLLNTMWAVHSRTVTGEVLGSGRGERNQVFAIRQTPVLAGQRLEVVEAEVPSAGERADLEMEEGADAVTIANVTNAAGTAEVRVRWHEVPDFYGSGPRSRHYTLDRATGVVTFGDGQRGLPPPPGRGNVRLAVYRAGGGLAGNRPAGNIAKLKGTVPYVKSVVQHEPAAGGAGAESLDQVRMRGPRTLRHRD
ncbi:MAG: hypothetical protein QOJ16_219, partial [Acidobacteriota bacterium]|nr:hypothetical protein [Acidobacteriota bacterium]